MILINDTIKSFFDKNNIEIEKLNNLISCRVYSEEELNEIVAKYKISDDSIKEDICIKDILGYDYEWRGHNNNLFNNLSCLFDRNGDGYHSRSVSMLDYSSDEVVDKLQTSFMIEPIKVSEIEPGKYVISENGLHRFTVLRTHYLNELSKVNKDDLEKINEINKKYTIPVNVSKTNYFKTYCNYMLNNLFRNVWVSDERDSNYKKTGKMVVEYQGKKLVLNNTEIINLIRENLDLNTFFLEFIIPHNCEKCETFKNFIEIIFPSLISNMERQIK